MEMGETCWYVKRMVYETVAINEEGELFGQFMLLVGGWYDCGGGIK